MAKAIFFGSPPVGHTYSTLPIIAELVRRGESIIYYSFERFADPIRATGAEYRAYKEFPEMPASTSVRMPEMLPILSGATEAILDNELPDAVAENPDYIIHDCLAIWGAEVARLIGVPRMATFPTFLANRSVEKFARGVMPRELLPGRSGLRITDVPMLWTVFQQRRRTTRKHGLEYKKVLELMHADFNVVFTTRRLQPFAEEFDERFCFIGSPTVEREEQTPFPFELLTGAPLIYVSLGTLFNDRPEFFQACFEAFGDMDVQVLLCRGKQNAALDALEAPANFLVRDYVPQVSLLKRSAAFVTHGGISGASEGLICGVPQVFLPQIWDGYLMAHQITAAGGGVMLPQPPTARDLREAVEKVLRDPSFREKSLELGRGLVEAGGARRAAEEMLRWTRQRLPALTSA
ncbi:MAG: hypothetical protein GC160_28800 [Acidobacteria bacterium]|nr:hypothetical protein [Acidobacteriota bacterium]